MSMLKDTLSWDFICFYISIGVYYESICKSINRVSLIQQIIIGLIIGILTALYVPDVANELALLGVLFVGALKGIAPILVFFLVIAAISNIALDKRQVWALL